MQRAGIGHMQHRMVAARAAKRAGKNDPIGTALLRLVDGQFAIGQVLFRRKGQPSDLRPALHQRFGRRIEIANPQLRLNRKIGRMPHAAIRGNDAGMADLPDQPVGYLKLSAEQNEERPITFHDGTHIAAFQDLASGRRCI